MSVRDFQTYSVYIPEVVKDSDANQHNVYIVLADVNQLQYIEDFRYFEEHNTRRFVRDANSKTANVDFVQNSTLANFPDLKRGDIMVVVTLRKMDGE